MKPNCTYCMMLNILYGRVSSGCGCRRSQEDGVEAGVFLWLACLVSVVVYPVVLALARVAGGGQ
ncbi:hypothetical protein BPY_17040 [Bifidobacterium psychraerophilum]